MAKKKQSDNEIIDELLATSSVAEEIIAAPVIKVKAEEKKAPGMYHAGRLITAAPARVGKTWTVIIDGKREKVLKSDIEFVG